MDEKYFEGKLKAIYDSNMFWQDDIEVLKQIAHDAKVEQEQVDWECVMNVEWELAGYKTKENIIAVLRKIEPKEGE